MSQLLDTNDEAHLRQVIISQCIWSDPYSSLKHILKRTADQLPLLVSFPNNDDEQQTSRDNDNHQITFFFDRNVSSKLLFTPLKQSEDKQDQFEVCPRHCTFATTDLFKGAFEFVRKGQRCSRIFTTLEQLVDFTTIKKCSVVFMSRDHIRVYYTDSKSSRWIKEKYSQGSVFHGQRIHRAKNDQKSDKDQLECLDEDGYTVFLGMNSPGRFSLIATSKDQQQNQPEIYIHSTQTYNISQLIKRLTSVDNATNNNCIRLVRGPVPHNFHIQYLQLARQQTYDVLVGVTQEGLVIEWNLESHAPCRYATNFNDILTKLSGTREEQLLEIYIDQARLHYREDFQINMQLISTRDWSAFLEFWKWIGNVSHTDKHNQNIPYQSRHRFHLIASIQDISDDQERLSTFFKKSPTDHHHHHSSQSSNEKHDKPHRKVLSEKQRIFFSEMNKLLTTSPKLKPTRMSLPIPRKISLLITDVESPFDNSVYDSNSQIINPSKINLSKPKGSSRRTQ